jgi:hypothetical protein
VSFEDDVGKENGREGKLDEDEDDAEARRRERRRGEAKAAIEVRVYLSFQMIVR